MTDVTHEYGRAAADLDAHVRDCPQCSAGQGCPDGDDTAEREFRAWRALQRNQTRGRSE